MLRCWSSVVAEVSYFCWYCGGSLTIPSDSCKEELLDERIPSEVDIQLSKLEMRLAIRARRAFLRFCRTAGLSMAAGETNFRFGDDYFAAVLHLVEGGDGLLADQAGDIALRGSLDSRGRPAFGRSWSGDSQGLSNTPIARD